MLQAVFASGRDEIVVHGLTQWDKNQKIQITLSSLPAVFQVHYSYKGCKEAYVVNAEANGGVAIALIPNLLLQQNKDAIAWIYASEDDSDATIKTIHLPITPRAKPSDYAYTEIEIQSVNSAAAYARAQGDYAYQKALAANEAAQNAPYVDAPTNHWMAWNAASGKYVDTGISATGAQGETGDNGVTPHIGDNGNWFVGNNDTGVKAQGPAGQNGTGSGTVTAVTVSGTKYEPDETGNVNLGELGGSDVELSDAAPKPLGSAASPGTGTLAAREDHVHKMPTAQDVGALPSDGTAANASKLGGKDAADYYNNENLVFDDAPVPGSTNPITSGAAADALGNKITGSANNLVRFNAVFDGGKYLCLDFVISANLFYRMYFAIDGSMGNKIAVQKWENGVFINAVIDND